MLPRWQGAFAESSAGKIGSARANATCAKVDLVWLRLEQGSSVASQFSRISGHLGRVPCIVLSDRPSDDEAREAFTSGARGYCNTHAAEQVLQNAADVVLQGGVWIGESLMQWLLAATTRVHVNGSDAMSASENWSSLLTDREKEVAKIVAGGASNKEIARTLKISERTVKAHIGAILEKLKVRDRLQLSLVVNGHSRTN